MPNKLILNPSKKTSVRIALTDKLRDALTNVQRLKYPFLKDDEIFKLGFSQLFAREMIPSNKHISISTLLIKIRQSKPEFGKKWLYLNSVDEESMTEDDFCAMVIAEITST